MRNIQKVFGLLAVLFFAVCIQATAVPSDVIGTNYEEAVERLGNLGIMIGDDTGFRPNDFITRAEFAVSIVRALGLEDTAKGISGNSQFDDVAVEDWFSGYVKVAADSKIINGMGDGNFNPASNVTYEQAVKMIMCALGYEEAAATKGGYPSGYIIAASDAEVSDGVTGQIGTPVNRGTVARLLDNALEVPMMIQKNYSKKKQWVVSGTSDTIKQTLLTTGLKLDEVEAQVISVDIAEQKIEVKKAKENGSNLYNDGVSRYTVNEDISLLGLENTKVTLWVNSSRTVLALKINDQTAVFDYIAEVNGDDTPGNTYISSFIKDLLLQNANDIYSINGNTSGSSDIEIMLNKQSVGNEPVAYVNLFAKFLMTDNRIDSIDAYIMTEGGIITNVTADSIIYTKGDLTGNSLNGLQQATSILVVIDGKQSEINQLSIYSVFDYWMSRDGKNVVIAASSKKVDGTLQAVGSDKIQIDKTFYDMGEIKWNNDPYYYSDNDKKYLKNNNSTEYLQQEVTVYVDGKNKIRYFKGNGLLGAPQTFTGVITKVYTDDYDYLKILRLTAGSQETSYALDLKNSEVSFAEAQAVASNLDGDGIFNFTLNQDGKIKNISRVAYYPYTGSSAASSSAKLSISKFSDDVIPHYNNIYMSNTTFIALTNVKGKFKPIILNWTNDLKNHQTTSGVTVKMDYDINHNPVPKFVVLTTGWDTLYYASTYPYYGFVTDMYSIGADRVEMTIVRSGKTETFQLDKSVLTKSISGQNIQVGKNSIVKFRTGAIGDNKIAFVGAYDLSDMANSWQSIPDVAGNPYAGFFTAGTVQDRMETAYLFSGLLSGYVQTSDPLIFEVDDEAGTDTRFIRRSLADVPIGAKAWCLLDSSPSPTVIKILIYSKN